VQQRGLSSHAAYSRVKERKRINPSYFFNPQKGSLLIFRNFSMFRSCLPLAALGRVSGSSDYSGERVNVGSLWFSDHYTMFQMISGKQ